MKITYTYEVKNKPEVEKAMQGYTKELLWRLANKCQEIAVQKAPVDMGRLKSSIHLVPMFKGAKTYFLVDGVNYGVHVEYGTRPHSMPIEPIKDWAKRHGIEDAAWAIWHKIRLQGTDAHPFMRPAFNQVKFKYHKQIAVDLIKTFSHQV